MLFLVSKMRFRHVLQRILDSNRSFNIHVGSPMASKVSCKPSQSSSDCGAAESSPPSGGSGSKGNHQITYTQYVAPGYKDHDHKNMGLKRPMSPHLTIYAPTMPAFTSICQRITGIIITFYAVMLSAGTLFLSNGVESYVSMIQSLDLSRPLILLIKIILGLPFAFHYFFGLRFCAWNAGRWLTMKDVTSTVKPLFIATAVITFFFAII